MGEIWDIISSEEFISDLSEIEIFIKSQYADLNNRYQIKNKLQLAAERLMYFHMHKNLKITRIYPSPISSDLAFYTEDALINIDAKTIDLSWNKGDDDWVQFWPHQISFTNKWFFERMINEIEFKWMSLTPGLPELDLSTNLPCLTYFVWITYKDDWTDFDISHIKLSCIPNWEIVREEYSNDLISNFKTYRYLKKDSASLFWDEYLPQDNILENWVPFNLKGISDKVDAWFDKSLVDPFDGDKNVIWKLLAWKYHICLSWDTARISPERIINRKNSKGDDWYWIRKKVVKEID